jgi:hypothetical protein
MNNFWGEPDEEPLPDWMNPKTYNQPKILQRSRQTLEEAAAAALKKPPVPILLKDPTKDE